jgi:nucleotidyltransferase/DNA polymerase involved in DNA repair
VSSDPLIVCVSIPRLELKVAVGDRAELLGVPIAIAPEPGGAQQVGEASDAAQAFGIAPGMRLGEALARCPSLRLIPPDPAGVADHWERLLMALEAVPSNRCARDSRASTHAGCCGYTAARCRR